MYKYSLKGVEMRFNQAYDVLQNFRKEVNQAELGRVLGVSRANINYKIKADVLLSDEDVKKIETYYNVSLSDEIKQPVSDNVTLDYFPDVFGSCGNGVFQFSTKKEQITLPQSIISKKVTPGKQYFVINAYGNSMQPLICDKDKLVIESYDGEQIIDNKPYLFAYKDEIFIKRLAKNVDQLMIIPENKDYDVRKLSGNQLKDVNIIGLVVGLMRDLR